MFSSRLPARAGVALAPMAAAIALATGCGGGSSGSTDSTPSTPQATVTVTATSSVSESTSPSLPIETLTTATQYAKAIDAAVSSATDVTTLTERTDSNNLLGRPNGYSSAAVVTDEAGDTSDTPGVDYGATVEVFGTESDAVRRSDYIQGLLKDSPVLGTEYDYVRAGVLLRVSGELPPSVATRYKAAFAATAD